MYKNCLPAFTRFGEEKTKMNLYNSLSRRIEQFKPIKPGEVTLYTCGPTVYDYAHLGNLRSFIFEDTLRRSLQLNGYNVKHVMNITDVGHLASDQDEGEDKLEKGAKRDSKTVWEVADYYTKAFQKDVKSLNILPPNGYKGEHGPYAKATQFIDQQIGMVKKLLEKDYAYQTNQAIYFDVTRLSSYGKLSGQNLSEKETAARHEVVVDKNKKNPQDFALWFFTVGRFSHHSMQWDSPWGEGFPGWHLECSAIIHATLGDPIDIHTGGVDHIGTHHTNEMAQTEAAFGNQLANYWLHNEFVLVEGRKMAKSLGNFYTLADVVKRGFSPAALRLLYLQSHYRSRINFTWISMQSAQNRLRSLSAIADLRWQVKDANNTDAEIIRNVKSKIEKAIRTDLNTVEALSALSEIESQPELIINSSGKEFESLLKYVDNIFGLNLLSSIDIAHECKDLIRQREVARQNKQWQKADDLRNSIAKYGIEVRDTESGPIWERS